MTRGTVRLARGFQVSPFLLEEMATPDIPHGIIKRLPVNVAFVFSVEGMDPMCSIVSQCKIRRTWHSLANQNVAVIFTPAPRFTFVSQLAFERVGPTVSRENNDICR